MTICALAMLAASCGNRQSDRQDTAGNAAQINIDSTTIVVSLDTPAHTESNTETDSNASDQE